MAVLGLTTLISPKNPEQPRVTALKEFRKKAPHFRNVEKCIEEGDEKNKQKMSKFQANSLSFETVIQSVTDVFIMIYILSDALNNMRKPSSIYYYCTTYV